MEKQKVIHIVAMDIERKYEREFNRWYDEEHVPALLKFPKIIEATLFQLTNYQVCITEKGFPKYLCIYVLENQQAWDEWQVSPERKAALKSKMRVGELKLKWRVQYRELKHWKI